MTTLIARRSLFALLPLALTLGAATASAEDARAPMQREGHRNGHHEGAHHGGGRGIHHLVEGVNLRPEQREAVMRLQREAMNDHEAIENLTKPYRVELAREVRGGAFDRALLDKLIAATAGDIAALPPAHAHLLAKLHSILDPAQRAQVADKLAKGPPMMGMGMGPGGDHDHKGPGRRHGGKHEGGPGAHRMEKFTEDLDLTPSQRDALMKAMHDLKDAKKGDEDHAAMRAEMEARHKALAERFRKDTFAVTEADKVPPAMATRPLSHLGEFAITATPILTVNQRQKLATHIEEGRHGHDDR
jgi:Spy/CpxP family protein refolding chaperone